MKALPGKISLALGPFCFRSHWVIALLIAFCTIILIKLGLWQLRRYQEKQQIIATYDARMALPAQNITQQHLITNHFKYLPVKLTGHFLGAKNFYLDNQFNRHRIGYHVYSPFQMSHPHATILINRGWIPVGADRKILPTAKTTEQEITLKGTIYYPQKGVILGENIDSTLKGWPKRIQFIDYPALGEALDTSLTPFIVRLDKDAPQGFQRDWQIVNMPPSRHLGYAVQWFGLAITLIVVYIAACTKREG